MGGQERKENENRIICKGIIVLSVGLARNCIRLLYQLLRLALERKVRKDCKFIGAYAERLDLRSADT